MKYFLGIVGILGFCDIVIFPSHRNTFDTQILYSMFSRIMERLSLIHGYRHN